MKKHVGEIKPLSLEALKKMDGLPVYVNCAEFPELNGWYITHLDKQSGRVECWGYDSTRMDSASYGSWLAYINKP